MLLVLGIPLVLMFVRELVRHNVFLQLLVGWIAILLTLAYFAKRRRLRRRVWLILLLIATAFYGVLVFVTDLPITTISIDLQSVPQSTEFVLAREGDTKSERTLAEYHGRSASEVRVNFLLRKAIGGTRRSFIVRFGTRAHSYNIMRLSYGTDLLLWTIPLAIFKGEDLVGIAMVNPQHNSLASLDSIVQLVGRHRGPVLIVPYDEALVRSTMPGSRVYLVKSLWFLIFVAISAATACFPLVAPRIAPIAMTVRTYLES